MTFQPHVTSTVVVTCLGYKDVPLKVVLFAWRLTTKDNLLCRGVIDDDSRMCVGGYGSLETSSHLFLHCNDFGWHFLYRWLGISSVIFFYVADHFNQFSYGGGGAKVQ